MDGKFMFQKWKHSALRARGVKHQKDIRIYDPTDPVFSFSKRDQASTLCTSTSLSARLRQS